MKGLKFILLLSVIMLCISCQQRKTATLPELVYDSLSIKLDYPYLPSYTLPRPFYRNDTLYVMAYNHLTHAYDFIDLSGAGMHFVIPLQREGKDGVGTSNDIFGMQEGVLVKEQTGFKWVDREGRVLQNRPIAEIRDSIRDNLYSALPHGVVVGGYSYATFDSLHHDIIFPLFPSGNVKLEDRVLGGKVDMTDGEFSFLPFHYPQMFGKETLNIGNFFTPQFTACDDRIIYNFYGFSKFWVFPSSGNGEVKEYDMPSRYTDNQTPVPAASMNVFNLFEQELMGLRFCEVHYIAPLHCYARVHYAPKKSRKDPLVSYLMIMDEAGTVLNEYLLPASFTGKYLMAGTDMYFFMLAEDGDNEMLLAKIQLGKLLGCDFR